MNTENIWRVRRNRLELVGFRARIGVLLASPGTGRLQSQCLRQAHCQYSI
jgi:hypothetical protein